MLLAGVLLLGYLALRKRSSFQLTTKQILSLGLLAVFSTENGVNEQGGDRDGRHLIPVEKGKAEQSRAGSVEERNHEGDHKDHEQ